MYMYMYVEECFVFVLQEKDEAEADCGFPKSSQVLVCLSANLSPGDEVLLHFAVCQLLL